MSTLSQGELLTPRQAADILGVKTQTLALWRSTGKHGLPFIKVGTSVRYRQTELDAWLRSRTVVHTGQLAD
jgi:excisionase family DNA binding protein